MSLLEPTLAEPATPDDFARQAAERITPLGEYLGAKLSAGLEGTRPGELYGLATKPGRLYGDLSTTIGGATDEFGRPSPGLNDLSGVPSDPLMSKDAYEASPNYRPGLEWDAGMTEARAAAQAATHDRQAYRESLIARSDAGAIGQTAGFLAGMGPAALDPTNYVPLLGPASKAAMVARFGRIGGALLGHGADAALNTGLFEPLAATTAQAQGRSYGWEEAGSDILTNALGGALLGTAAGEAARALGFGHGLPKTPEVLGKPEAPGIGGLAEAEPLPTITEPVAPPIVGVPEAGAGISLDDMARRRGALEGQIMGGMAPAPWGPFDVMPYDELRQVVERDGAALADVQAHGIAGANPEHQLDALLTGGIDKGRAFHTGPLGQSGDPTVRAGGLGAKVDAPYVLLGAPGERMKEGGIRAVVVNGAAKANLDDLKARYPGVTFLAPDEVAGWAKGADGVAAPPEPGAGVVPRRPGQPPLRVDDLMRRADAADLALDQIDRGEPVDVGKVLANDPAVRAEATPASAGAPRVDVESTPADEGGHNKVYTLRDGDGTELAKVKAWSGAGSVNVDWVGTPTATALHDAAEIATGGGGLEGRAYEAAKNRLGPRAMMLLAREIARDNPDAKWMSGYRVSGAREVAGEIGETAIDLDRFRRRGPMSLEKATPEPPHPSVAEAAPRVGKDTPELETFAKDAKLEGYDQPLPGHEPKPEPVPGEPAKPEKVPTPAEKAAATAALPPELGEVEAMRREGSLTPADEATLAAGEAEATRAESYADAWTTLVACVARNA